MEIKNGCIRKISGGLNINIFDIITIVSVSVQFKERERTIIKPVRYIMLQLVNKRGFEI